MLWIAAHGWSQAFYLPSCPRENKDDAFFVHNQGVHLPVNEFVRRGQEIIAARKSRLLSKLGNNVQAFPPIFETPENIERSNQCSRPANIKYDPWRNVVWAVASTGWKCAERLARNWSETAPEKWDEKQFETVWNSFDPQREKSIGFGTLDRIAKQHGGVGPSTIGTDPCTIDGERFSGSGGDMKNGKIFASMFRTKLLHIHEISEWLMFDHESGWVSSPPGEADRAAKEALATVRNYASERYKAAPEDPNTKRLMAHVERASKAPNLRAAKSEPGMTLQLSEFDNDLRLLGVANGVLDLNKGTLLPVSPEVLVSKRCNVAYVPSATCPQFLRYLEEVQPDVEVRAFLQRFAGYCLTGEVGEKKFLMLTGAGDNGKTVLSSC